MNFHSEPERMSGNMGRGPPDVRQLLNDIMDEYPSDDEQEREADQNLDHADLDVNQLYAYNFQHEHEDNLTNIVDSNHNSEPVQLQEAESSMIMYRQQQQQERQHNFATAAPDLHLYEDTLSEPLSVKIHGGYDQHDHLQEPPLIMSWSHHDQQQQRETTERVKIEQASSSAALLRPRPQVLGPSSLAAAASSSTRRASPLRQEDETDYHYGVLFSSNQAARVARADQDDFLADESEDDHATDDGDAEPDLHPHSHIAAFLHEVRAMIEAEPSRQIHLSRVAESQAGKELKRTYFQNNPPRGAVAQVLREYPDLFRVKLIPPTTQVVQGVGGDDDELDGEQADHGDSRSRSKTPATRTQDEANTVGAPAVAPAPLWPGAQEFRKLLYTFLATPISPSGTPLTDFGQTAECKQLIAKHGSRPSSMLAVVRQFPEDFAICYPDKSRPFMVFVKRNTGREKAAPPPKNTTTPAATTPTADHSDRRDEEKLELYYKVIENIILEKGGVAQQCDNHILGTDERVRRLKVKYNLGTLLSILEACPDKMRFKVKHNPDVKNPGCRNAYTVSLRQTSYDNAKILEKYYSAVEDLILASSKQEVDNQELGNCPRIQHLRAKYPTGSLLQVIGQCPDKGRFKIKSNKKTGGGGGAGAYFVRLGAVVAPGRKKRQKTTTDTEQPEPPTANTALLQEKTGPTAAASDKANKLAKPAGGGSGDAADTGFWNTKAGSKAFRKCLRESCCSGTGQNGTTLLSSFGSSPQLAALKEKHGAFPTKLIAMIEKFPAEFKLEQASSVAGTTGKTPGPVTVLCLSVAAKPDSTAKLWRPKPAPAIEGDVFDPTSPYPSVQALAQNKATSSNTNSDGSSFWRSETGTEALRQALHAFSAKEHPAQPLLSTFGSSPGFADLKKKHGKPGGGFKLHTVVADSFPTEFALLDHGRGQLALVDLSLHHDGGGTWRKLSPDDETGSRRRTDHDEVRPLAQPLPDADPLILERYFKTVEEVMRDDMGVTTCALEELESTHRVRELQEAHPLGPLASVLLSCGDKTRLSLIHKSSKGFKSKINRALASGAVNGNAADGGIAKTEYLVTARNALPKHIQEEYFTAIEGVICEHNGRCTNVDLGSNERIKQLRAKYPTVSLLALLRSCPDADRFRVVGRRENEPPSSSIQYIVMFGEEQERKMHTYQAPAPGAVSSTRQAAVGSPSEQKHQVAAHTSSSSSASTSHQKSSKGPVDAASLLREYWDVVEKIVLLFDADSRGRSASASSSSSASTASAKTEPVSNLKICNHKRFRALERKLFHKKNGGAELPLQHDEGDNSHALELLTGCGSLYDVLRRCPDRRFDLGEPVAFGRSGRDLVFDVSVVLNQTCEASSKNDFHFYPEEPSSAGGASSSSSFITSTTFSPATSASAVNTRRTNNPMQFRPLVPGLFGGLQLCAGTESSGQHGPCSSTVTATSGGGGLIFPQDSRSSFTFARNL
ncbi:unnamed protein product [Amoebophrya sp. A120]|nr:unnamed protein product [Amoebophrya sp. A120]|eukprot:GSA120T00006831001.1